MRQREKIQPDWFISYRKIRQDSEDKTVVASSCYLLSQLEQEGASFSEVMIVEDLDELDEG